MYGGHHFRATFQYKKIYLQVTLTHQQKSQLSTVITKNLEQGTSDFHPSNTVNLSRVINNIQQGTSGHQTKYCNTRLPYASAE